MYKSSMKKINFAVSDIEYRNLKFLKSLLGYKTDSSCFRFCLEYTFCHFYNKKDVCSDSRLRDEFNSFRNELYSLLRSFEK